MKPIEFSEALTKLQANRRDEEALAVVRAKLGSAPALMVADGKIDVVDTLDALDHYTQHGSAAPGAVRLEDWLQEGKADTEASPVTREPLFKGKESVQRPPLPPIVVDWTPISQDLREVASYAADAGWARDPEMVVAALRRAPNLSDEWARAQRDWNALCDLKKPTPEQRATIERVQQRLVFQRLAPPMASPAPLSPPKFPGQQGWGAGKSPAPIEMTEPCAADGMAQCPGFRGLGGCADPGEIGRCGRRIPGGTSLAPSAGRAVVILSAPADESYRNLLVRFLGATSDVQVWHDGMIRAGQVPAMVRAHELRKAAVVVHLYSADSDMDARSTIAAAPLAVHVPVAVRPCMGPPFGLESMERLPRHGRPISAAPDREAAMLEVAQAIHTIAAAR